MIKALSGDVETEQNSLSQLKLEILAATHKFLIETEVETHPTNKSSEEPTPEWDWDDRRYEK